MVHAAPPPTRADADVRIEAARRAIMAAGGGAKLASKIGVTRYAVQQWKAAGIPPARVPAVSRITGIPLHDLRPDVFDPPVTTSAVAQPQVAA